MRDATSPCGGN